MTVATKKHDTSHGPMLIYSRIARGRDPSREKHLRTFHTQAPGTRLPSDARLCVYVITMHMVELAVSGRCAG
jgi:hypothetical protein